MKPSIHLKVIFLVVGLSVPMASWGQKDDLDLAQANAIQQNMIGSKIPDLQFEKLIQGPDSTLITQKSLEGKIVILDFWTTFCAPCIKEFPRLNTLSETYKDQVVFISITPEKFEKANRVLSKRPLKTWVAMDTDQSVLNTFGVFGFPTTVAIDKTGMVIEYLHPINLTVDYLDNLLLGNIEEAKAQSQSDGHTPIASFLSMVDMSSDPSFQVVTRDSTKAAKAPVNSEKPDFAIRITKRPANPFGGSGGGLVSRQNGLIMMDGWTLRKALAFAADMPEALIFGPDSLLDKRMEVTAKLPKSNPELMNNLLMHSLQEEFGFKSVLIDQKVDLFELRAPNGANSKNLHPSDGSPKKMSMADGVISITNQPVSSILFSLQNLLSTTIIDKTNLKESYDFQLYWDKDNMESIKKALAEQLGLSIVKNSDIKQTLKVVPINTKNSISLRGG